MSSAESGDSPRKLHELSDDELALLADGCTEQTCVYHGEVNRERRRRQHNRAPSDVD